MIQWWKGREVGVLVLEPSFDANEKYILKVWSGIQLVAYLSKGNQKLPTPLLTSVVWTAKDVVSIFLTMWAGGAFVLAVLFPPADDVVGGYYVMNQFGERDTLVDVAAYSEFVGSPVDGLEDGRGPAVALLDVLFKGWAVGGGADGGFQIVGDGPFLELELGAGMGKE
jgi:hypothetical protein